MDVPPRGREHARAPLLQRLGKYRTDAAGALAGSASAVQSRQAAACVLALVDDRLAQANVRLPADPADLAGAETGLADSAVLLYKLKVSHATSRHSTLIQSSIIHLEHKLKVSHATSSLTRSPSPTFKHQPPLPHDLKITREECIEKSVKAVGYAASQARLATRYRTPICKSQSYNF